ncbi:MAG: Negative regulator of genetic competence ClpC/MecB [Phycisphaerae bacterium]|nr:Negative regulator of genetic competence ClpC/MecB [Phycisphaerae bacterium]
MMLPKASARVEKVIKLANAVAREYDREYVGTEHLLLAIASDGTGLGAEILSSHGATPEKLRREVDALVQKSLEETWVFGRLPGTPHFKNVMAVAVEQCQQLEGRELCTEHLLLALLKEPGCIACKALKALGVTYDKVRGEVLAAAG